MTLQYSKMPVHPQHRQTFGSHEPKFSEMKTNPKEKDKKETEFSASNGSARGETCICATNQRGDGYLAVAQDKIGRLPSQMRWWWWCGFLAQRLVSGSSLETAVR